MPVENFFAEKIKENLGLNPTADQFELFKSLAGFVTSDDDDIMVVSGYAGTGKTSAIAAFVKTLRQFRYKYVLLAPTGRSAKVLSGFTSDRAFTVHKHIYRQKSIKDGIGLFDLDINKAKDTFFIVDEASLITIDGGANSIFGSGNLLDDLISYVRSNQGNNLILVGDKGQLPPVGLVESPALAPYYMAEYGKVVFASLSQVVRQAAESGILYNATIIRKMIEKGEGYIPKMSLDSFKDVERVAGADLIEKIEDSLNKYGIDNVVVLCRSNKRANRYNAGIRNKVLMREEKLIRGDKLMVVKNCYQFLEDLEDDSFFIANGDVAELVRISKYEERYGINFAEAVLLFPDYNNLEITAKIILNTLDSETPSLSAEYQRLLFEGVFEDYSDVKSKKKRYAMVREDKYFNALQIKYATAITCHKSQGGQWSCVFIDNPFINGEISVEDLKWLYTAVTRGVDKVYFINFNDNFFNKA